MPAVKPMVTHYQTYLTRSPIDTIANTSWFKPLNVVSPMAGPWIHLGIAGLDNPCDGGRGLKGPPAGLSPKDRVDIGCYYLYEFIELYSQANKSSLVNIQSDLSDVHYHV